VSGIRKILEGQAAREVNGDRQEFIEPVVIAGLALSQTLLLDALDDAACPQPFDPLYVGSPLRVVERMAKPISANEVLVECVYRRLYVYPDYLRSGSGALETVESARSSQDPATWTPNLVGPATKQQCAVIQAQMAQQVLRFERVWELDDPAVDQRKYLNKVNDDEWYGLGPTQWLCTKFDYEFLCGPGIVSPLGASPAWNVVMEFTSKKYGWQPIVEWVDPETGKPPSNTMTFAVSLLWYESENFLDLEIGGGA
jgi:hypothetical protein